MFILAGIALVAFIWAGYELIKTDEEEDNNDCKNDLDD